MQLTGELPFQPCPTDEKPLAPDWLPEDQKERWQECEAMLRLHEAWVRPGTLM